ncbi:MAG: hypothetical protein CVU44_11185 [Chloroflexi bacterium HGW-Chloroflexi-6]|nr:MAG: hypothetical protein CVU44_11185 [Chloroflexi bacterium HGW-Chloroflexi-6]
MASVIRPTNNPLCTYGGTDRLLLDDVSPYGLRRKVIASKGVWPDVSGFLDLAAQEAKGADVYWWLFERDDGFMYLWICWKKSKEEKQS